MSKSEKIYFKKFSAIHVIGVENSYVTLFNEIDRQSHHDEKKILDKLYKHHKNSFAVAKNYLFDHLLASLESFHHSVQTELFGLIRRADILQGKGLTRMALKLIRRAKEKALKYEDFILLCMIIKSELDLLVTIIKTTEESEYFDKLNNDYSGYLVEIKIISEFESIYYKLLMHYRIYGRPRNEKVLNKLKPLISFVEGFNKINSVKSNILKYKIIAYYSYYIKSDLKASVKHYQKLRDLILGSKNLILCNPRFYLDYYLQSTYPLIDMGYYEQALANTEEIYILSSAMVKSTPALEANIFNISYLLKCEIYIQSGRYSEGMSVIEKIAKDLSHHKNYLNKTHVIYYYYNFSYICFGAGNYRQALKWMNLYLNEKEVETRLDRQAFARILYILIHYELGNFQLLESLFSHTSRFFRHNKYLFKTEERLLVFIKSKLLGAIENKVLICEFKNLLKDLNRITADPLEKNSLEFFDYLSWIKSKIESKPFEETVINKTKL